MSLDAKNKDIVLLFFQVEATGRTQGLQTRWYWAVSFNKRLSWTQSEKIVHSTSVPRKSIDLIYVR
jgi:hypothetical protein